MIASVCGPFSIQRLLDRHEFLDVSSGKALADLTSLLSLVRAHGFTAGCRLFFSDDSIPLEPLVAVKDVAHRIARCLGSSTDAAVFAKALQEAFLDVSGLEYDLEFLDVDWGLKKFLVCHEVSGFIQMFLSLFVFQSVWLAVQDEVRAHLTSERACLDQMSVVRAMSQKAVRDIIARLSGTRELDLGILRPQAGVKLMAEIRNRVLRPA